VGDVAHRAELTEQLTAQAVEQGRRAAADELVAILAHDLRNYLTPLGARLQLIGRRAQQDQRPRDLRDLAAAQAMLDRLQRLIADLLDSARLEQGIFQLSPEPLNLAVLARDVVRDLAVPEVPVRVRGTDELVVTADPRRLRQALDNLLANAIRHSPEGGAVELELAAERRETGVWAVLSVADQGAGIPPEVRPRLFQRFSTGPGSVGLGLGLYLAHRITAAHGGTLTADFSTRRGARFVLSLPAENHELAPGSERGL
jgi:signal transduction histidine kinase